MYSPWNDQKFEADVQKEVSLKLKNALSELEKIKEGISDLLIDHPLQSTMDFEFNLVAEELITNVISYAFVDGLEHEFDVTLSVTENSWELLVEDDGTAFNPVEAADPDVNRPLSERALGGLGIFMVKKIAGELFYARKEGKNLVRARKVYAS